jgi:transcriptional regulator with XRE-family HTH domain
MNTTPHLPLLPLPDLIDSRLKQIRQRGRTARQVAAEAKMNETTLSMIRNGNRRVTQDVAKRLARALALDPEEESKLARQLLMSAGYLPANIAEGRVIAVSELWEPSELDHLFADLAESDQVWVFSRSISESHSDSEYITLRDSLKRSVGFSYFIDRANALDYLKIMDRLQNDTIPTSSLRCVVLPDAAFHYADTSFCQRLYRAGSDDGLRAFRSSREIAGKYLYRELSASDAKELRNYLSEMSSLAYRPESRELPLPAELVILDKISQSAMSSPLASSKGHSAPGT